MDCSNGSCTARLFKSLTGFIGDITGVDTDCIAAKLRAPYIDTMDCITDRGTFSINPRCCAYPEMYNFSTPLYCTNQNFVYGSGCYNANDKTYCPTAGILDAYTQSHGVWGRGVLPHVGYFLTPDCFDDTPIQQNHLYTLTHQFCPNLRGDFSYSTDMQNFLFRNQLFATFSQDYNPDVIAGLNDLSCCTRDDQSNPFIGSEVADCHMMTCYESPMCIEQFQFFCGNPVYAQYPNIIRACAKWQSFSMNNATSVISADDESVPTAGTNPASVDQAYFNVLNYCSSTNNSICDAILAVGGGLLFPRFDSLHVGDISNQLIVPTVPFAPYVPIQNLRQPYYMPNTSSFQTVTFTVTNLSNVIISSLSVRQTNDNYTINIDKITLGPFETANVTVSTDLQQSELASLYYFSKTQKVFTDGYNLNNDCAQFGYYAQDYKNIDPNKHSDVPDEYYVLPNCAAGDKELGVSSFTSAWAFQEFPKKQSDIWCNQRCGAWEWTAGLDPGLGYPGCKIQCDTYAGCRETTITPCLHFDSDCSVGRGLYTTVTAIKTCSTVKFGNHPFYFYDAAKVDPDASDFAQRADYPILGGFVSSIEANIFDLSFSTTHLVVLPLTNATYLVL